MALGSDVDAVVVGAGPGGLSAAAYLARMGKRVVVVEARDQAGGHMSTFRRDGYEFDIGLHFVVPQLIEQVLRPLGVSVAFREHDPDAMFTVRFPDRDLSVAVPRGIDRFRARLAETFPAERKVVDAFLDTVASLARELDRISEQPSLRELPALPWQMRHVLLHSRSTVGSYLDDLSPSPRLRSTLSWLHGIIALPPSRISLIAYAAAAAAYLGDCAYPEGGSAAIRDGLVAAIQAHGGEILLGTEVSAILVERGRVRGVRVRPAALDAAVEPGWDILAPTVVAANDLKRTILELLPSDSVPDRFRRRVRGFEMALPLFVVYLVLDQDLRGQRYRNTNMQIMEGDGDLEALYAALRAGEPPAAANVQITCGNLADPNNPRLCRPGQTNLQLIGVAPMRHDFWGALPGWPSAVRYHARRQEIRDRLVGLAERVLPGLTDSIAFEDVATPVTDEGLMRCTGGTSYGIAMTPRQGPFTRPGPTGPVPGLFLAGASSRFGHGIGGTLMSGAAAAAAITGMPTSELLAQTPPSASVTPEMAP
jgi:phytoene dehydrogenase-like protein